MNATSLCIFLDDMCNNFLYQYKHDTVLVVVDGVEREISTVDCVERDATDDFGRAVKIGVVRIICSEEKKCA